MKFICCLNNNQEEGAFDVYTLPDTALHINKRPFFIPDYAMPCLMHQHRAVRICRLGRSISARFAHRYYDAATLCTRMEAPSLPKGIGRCFDECLAVGEWLDLEKALPHPDAAGLADEADRAIAHVSQFFTLRQGDIILLTPTSPTREAHIGQHVALTWCDTDVLQINIK